MWYVKNSQWVQNAVFPNGKSYFSQFILIDKYLKFEKIEYLIHYNKFKVWSALHKFSLFSTVKLNLGDRFSQFILRFKIGIF